MSSFKFSPWLRLALVVLAIFHVNLCRGGFVLNSCAVTWQQGEGEENGLVRIPGPPGKRGPPGATGSRGLTGRQGERGPPGESCDCSRYQELEGDIAEIIASFRAKEKLLREAGYYQATNKMWYKVFTIVANYTTAKADCLRQGGRLAAEGMRDAAVRREITDGLVKPNGKNVWIGLDDLEQQYSWVWSDGVAGTRGNTPWAQSQPSNSGGIERCGHLYRLRQWLVNDAQCLNEWYYLCERTTF